MMVTTTHNAAKPKASGFSLVELLIAIFIVGILGSIALPQYFNQVQKARQNEAAASLSQIQTTIAAFVDEMGLLPESWGDLNKITPLMTPEGPANDSNFSSISLASTGCSETLKQHCYQVNISENKQIFILQAKPANSDAKNYNIVACLNLRTGSSDLRKGTNSKAVNTADLRCAGQN
jgi:prepilin-type N-terminal cleavage/methylation domain-containing protein